MPTPHVLPTPFEWACYESKHNLGGNRQTLVWNPNAICLSTLFQRLKEDHYMRNMHSSCSSNYISNFLSHKFVESCSVKGFRTCLIRGDPWLIQYHSRSIEVQSFNKNHQNSGGHYLCYMPQYNSMRHKPSFSKKWVRVDASFQDTLLEKKSCI